MQLHLYDTKTRGDIAVAMQERPIHIYCCGPTVYRNAHVGNLRTFLLSDLIRRALELSGQKVTLIQNITDVGHMSDDFEAEDKILAQSAVENIDPFEIARKYEEKFHTDLALLNIIPADRYPRASECIPMMQELIAKLIANKNAYIGSDGCVYFDAKSYPTYGELSGNRLDALKPGHRFEFSGEDGKRFHADWALWKAAGARKKMIWDSPWGPGFPGWHIECSAMSLKFLDEVVDVHVGGIDLRFPHHENERAQSNSLSGKEIVVLWSHGEHLLFEGRKMSKSSGNVVLLQDVVKKGFDPLAIRLALLENRYRSQMDLSWDSIAAAHSTLRRWRKLVSQSPSISPFPTPEISHAINADLDTPRVIQILREIEKNGKLSAESKIGAFLFADLVLGLRLDHQAAPPPLPNHLAQMLSDREYARDSKNWAESDRLRQELESSGLVIKDGPTAQEWEWR